MRHSIDFCKRREMLSRFTLILIQFENIPFKKPFINLEEYSNLTSNCLTSEHLN